MSASTDPTVMLLRSFFLATMAGQYEEVMQRAEKEGWSHRQVLRHLCESEAVERGQKRTARLLAGSGLFGYSETLGLRAGGDSVHALLLAVAVLAIAAAVWQARQQQQRAAIITGVVAVGLGALYFAIDEVPGDFSTMTPYVVTLLVLAFASQRLRMPAADGQIYRKGSAG